MPVYIERYLRTERRKNMTRGKIVAVTDTELWSSVEFNGDMYPDDGGHGEEVIEGLKECKTLMNYRGFCEEFNNENFQYEGEFECEDGEDGELFIARKIDPRGKFDLEGDSYFEKWFSDWLYVKNFGTRNADFIDRDGKPLVIEPGEIAAITFGRLAFKNEIPEEPVRDIDKIELCLDDWRDPSGVIAYAGDEVVSSAYCEDAGEFNEFLDEIGSRINTDDVKLMLKADMTCVGDSNKGILRLAKECQQKLDKFIEDATWKGEE